MTCSADATETCGGSWRNSIWYTATGTIAPAPTPAPLPAGSAFVGCYVDDGTRALPNALIGSASTVEGCISAAQTANYKYAGLQYGGQCFAGNTLGFASAPASDCNMPCDANKSGDLRRQLAKFDLFYWEVDHLKLYPETNEKI